MTSTQRLREPFLDIKNVTKVYPTKKGPFTVLDGVNLTVNQGEFICVIGHSGCGKSTLLNMVSGFNFPTSGQVLLEGKPITKPGPDRMVVFQNYALLPWRTAFDNIYLAVNAVYPDKPTAEKRAITAGASVNGRTSRRRRQKATSIVWWYETTGFYCPSFGYPSESVDFR